MGGCLAILKWDQWLIRKSEASEVSVMPNVYTKDGGTAPEKTGIVNLSGIFPSYKVMADCEDSHPEHEEAAVPV